MKPNVFFLIIDAFRNDEFRKFCRLHPTSNLNKLVSKGNYFSQTVSSADATLLSLASIFTGLYPFKTGIKSEKLNKLNSNVTTFFDFLKLENYNCYGYNPTVVNLANLLPTFENDDSAIESSPALTRGLGEKLLQNLDKLKEPWLIFVHSTDLHDPIIIPKEFDQNDFGSNQYERQISAIDNQLGKILKKIDFAKTLVVITADHGTYLKQMNVDNKNINFEDNIKTEILQKEISKKIPAFLGPLKDKIFFSTVERRRKSKLKKIENIPLEPYQRRNLTSEKFNTEHYLFDELVMVPLLFAGYSCNQKKMIDNQVRTVDIFPTLLKILGIKFDENSRDGRSLVSLMNGKNCDELEACMESNPLIQIKSNDVIGIRTSTYKYFRDVNESTKRVNLYDLVNDPFENINIAERNPEVVKEFEMRLQIILNQDVNLLINEDDESSEAISNELKKMGYT